MIRIDRAPRSSTAPLVAVDDLDLEIAPGEVFGFLGRNGAGKTTTIRMMVGLLEPTAGTVLLGGHDIRRASPRPRRRSPATCPISPFLYDKLTGNEFLRFIGGLYGVDRARARASGASTLLDEFGLVERRRASWSRPTRTA